LRREFGKSGRYFEPFLGGGAAFFQLLPKVSLLSDINAELIEFYEVMRDDPDGLMRSVWRNSNDRENYYRVRSSSPRTALGRAARFLYLNRTCWGGVYRVNKQGKFNVPFGNSGRHICRKAAVLQAAAALRHSDLRIRDFELALDESTAGDVVYLDPPYSQGFGKDCFGRYNSVRFEWEDHLRLVKASKRAARRGAFVVISAAMHKDLLETLPRWTVLSFDRNSLVGRSRASRLPVTEALLFSRVPAFTALGDE
jgi:DNA adenine methylase